jgi:twitching motility protein PilT
MTGLDEISWPPAFGSRGFTEVIAEGEYYGMRTFDQSLLGYVMEGKVAEEVALDYASNPHDFKLMPAAGGRRASGIEQLSNPA